MTYMLWAMLFLALLLCAAKASLAERGWEIFAASLMIAVVPLVLHPFVIRVSFMQVVNMLGYRDVLTSLSALLALDAILSLLLTAAVMRAHAHATPGGVENEPFGRGNRGYGALWALVGAGFLAAALAGSRLLLLVAALQFVFVLLWPWLPSLPISQKVGRISRNLGMRRAGMLVTPLWVLLSPTGVAAIAGVHLHLLNNASAVELWRVTAFYAAGLLIGLCAAAFALRLTMRRWHLRLEAVMLMAFMLLMVAMSLPQLLDTAPPPASLITIDWKATAVFVLLFLVFAAAAAQNRHRGGQGINAKGI